MSLLACKGIDMATIVQILFASTSRCRRRIVALLCTTAPGSPVVKASAACAAHHAP